MAASAAVDCTTLAPYVLDTSPDCTCSVRAPSVHTAGLEGSTVRAVHTAVDGELSYLMSLCCCKERQGEDDEVGAGAGAAGGTGYGYERGTPSSSSMYRIEVTTGRMLSRSITPVYMKMKMKMKKDVL